MVKLGIIREIVSKKMFIKTMDLMVLLPQKRKPPRKEGMRTWHQLVHIQILSMLIDLGVSFHLNSLKEWFCEYEKHNGGDLLSGYDLIEKTTKSGRV